MFLVFLDRQARVEKGMALEVLGLDSTTYAAQVLDPLGQEWVEQSMATLALLVLIRLSSRTFSPRVFNSFVRVGF